MSVFFLLLASPPLSSDEVFQETLNWWCTLPCSLQVAYSWRWGHTAEPPPPRPCAVVQGLNFQCSQLFALWFISTDSMPNERQCYLKKNNKKKPLSEKWSEKNCFLNVRRARELDVIPQWRVYLERWGGWLFPFAEDNSANFGKHHNRAVPQQITTPWQSRSHGHMGCASLLPIPFYCVYVLAAFSNQKALFHSGA